MIREDDMNAYVFWKMKENLLKELNIKSDQIYNNYLNSKDK
jgi:hypothetical protein